MGTTKHVTLWKLFCRSFLLSGTTIGGGFVILSAMDRTYVRKLGWLSEDEMLDITSLAQSAPGAVAVNASLLTGMKLRGTTGAVISLIGCVLPPFGIMYILGSLYGLIRESEAVSCLLLPIKLAIGLFLFRIAFSLCRKNLTTTFDKAVFVLVLAGIFIFRIQSVWFLIIAAVLAATRYFRRKKHE